MFHVFDKVYLEYDFLYTSLYPSIVLSTGPLEDPFSPDQIEGPVASCEDDESCQFWEKIKERAKGELFYVYADKERYFYLQLQLWKSVIAGNSKRNCYFLHKISTQDFLIKNHFFSANLKSRVNYANCDVKSLTEDEFEHLYLSVDSSAYLSSLSGDSLSFEYILATYLAGMKSEDKIQDVFFDKLKMFSLKFLKSEIQILKGDMISGFYDFTKKKFNLEQIEDSIEYLNQFVLSDPSLMWILDDHLLVSDLAYIQENYTSHTFIDLINIQTDINSGFKDLPAVGDNITKMIQCIFDENYNEVFNTDINKGFGSYLFNNSNGHKINLLLISYIYDLYRNQDLSKLKDLGVSLNDL